MRGPVSLLEKSEKPNSILESVVDISRDIAFG